MDDKTADRRSELEKAECREKRILFMVSGVIAPALAPVVFVWVVVNTMEPSDRIPGWGPCPTTEGLAAGAAGAGVLVVIACVLVGRALKNWDCRNPVNVEDDRSGRGACYERPSDAEMRKQY